MSLQIGMDRTTLLVSNMPCTQDETQIASLEDVTRSFGEFSLRDINLKIDSGKVLLIAGANGAGKSTLLNILIGTVEPDEGTVRVFGKPRSKLSQSDRKAISCSLDRKLLPDGLSVRLLLKSAALACGNWDQKRARTLLEHFGILNAKKVRDLSEGMKTKLGITVALSRVSKLLILDEPFAGLDADSQDRVVKELDSAKRSGTAIVLSSHQFDKLDGLVDNILVLTRGQQSYSMQVAGFLSMWAKVVVSGGTIDAGRFTIVKQCQRDSTTVYYLHGSCEVVSKALKTSNIAISRPTLFEILPSLL